MNYQKREAKKIIPFTIASKNKKINYLGINLTKEIRRLILIKL